MVFAFSDLVGSWMGVECFSGTGGWVADIASPSFLTGSTSTVAYERAMTEERTGRMVERRRREVGVRRAAIIRRL